MRRLFHILTVILTVSCTSNVGSEGRSGWMQPLPDDMQACMLSIPGAHDACTAGVRFPYTLFAQTQALDIKGLWDAGVRSFDIRPSSREDHLGVFHMKADTHSTFDEVVSTLASCLRDNPSEFAVVVMRHESEADIADNFESLMGEYMRTLPEGLAIGFRDDMTLGELRGHILFLSRSKYDDGPVGAYLEGWPDETVAVNAEGETATVAVQDHYDPKGKQDKMDALSSSLEANASGARWSVSHASAYTGISNYVRNARNVNSDTADIIAAGTAKTGIVVMDFAGVDVYKGRKVAGHKLVEAIIENNFK